MNSRPTAEPERQPILRLYVAGDTPSARRALDSRERLIAEAAGMFDVEVVNILERPADAERAGILATPTLSDESIAPPRRLVGDISNTTQVLEYFGYSKKDAHP
ncbi:circadian clock KaiB family protein [Rhizorhabdus histidinilytica]|uniref:circadian clock KaiB family protein n=1 Tax=Rhizorhabdus histidinilytica TaxID=439228 RepID=UPI00321F9EB5